jgi:beta-galactosidase
MGFWFGYFAKEFQDDLKEFLGIDAKKTGNSSVEVISRTNRVFGDDDEVLSEYRTTYKIFGDGAIHVTNEFEISAIAPRFGMQMGIPRDFRTIEWLGRGPHENYWDRKKSAMVGRYTLDIEEFIHDYVVPQENGNRTDIRWFALLNEDENGLVFTGDDLISCSAWPYSQEKLDKALHINELKPYDDEITVNIDMKQMGVGGGGCGALPPEKYMIEAGAYTYGFTVKPYRKDKDGDLNHFARKTYRE